ncbi:hypothetical protein ACIP9H_40340 [Streptomyces sp. NPDC088732]|uniref:hypothetical protein n=1 Tax=Streptomyces sp. NPDC088732 TaxID=3365879 RepID=UPI003818E1AE
MSSVLFAIVTSLDAHHRKARTAMTEQPTAPGLPPTEPCTKHTGDDRALYGCSGPDPAQATPGTPPSGPAGASSAHTPEAAQTEDILRDREARRGAIDVLLARGERRQTLTGDEAALLRKLVLADRADLEHEATTAELAIERVRLLGPTLDFEATDVCTAGPARDVLRDASRRIRTALDGTWQVTGCVLRSRLAAALVVEHRRRAAARIVASPEEHSAAMAEVVVLALTDPDLTGPADA